MATNKMIATQALDYRVRKNDFTGLRAPGMLAKWPIIGFFMFIFGSLMFGGLAYNLVAQGPLLNWDRVIAFTLPAIALKSPAFVKSILDSGFYIGKQGIIAGGILLGIYFIYKRYWQELAMVTIGLAGSTLLFYSLTALFARQRPPTQIWIIVNLPGFPSGHALTVVAFYGLLAYLIAPKMPSAFWKGFVVAMALLMMGFVGFTRIFTGGHYLTDILAGYAVGIAWSGMAYTLIEIVFRKIRKQNVKKE